MDIKRQINGYKETDKWIQIDININDKFPLLNLDLNLGYID